MADTTEMIENKIKKAQSWEEMEEILSQLPQTSFTVKVDEFCTKYEVKSFSQLQIKTGIPKSTFYSIMNGTRTPGKQHIIQIAFALGMNLEELNELLKVAKLKELYAKNKEDAIIIFGLKTGKDIYEIDELLEQEKCELRFVESDDVCGGKR
ncbi:MAG: bacteriophage CI repressor [Ruminococcaceae bacterium]|nr:bacteriophage CI repressor [Oscillospiraceae bacterium]